MLNAKLIYRADVNGDLTVEQQIEQAKNDSIKNGVTNRDFSISLKYDITRTVVNIFGNSVITYAGKSDAFTESLQKNLLKIYFKLHDHGYCYLKTGEGGAIIDVNTLSGSIKIPDPAYEISKITQKQAAEKALEMYGVITNAMFSVLDERGVLGVFSPQKDVVVKKGQANQLYDAFANLFGVKKGQRKYMLTEVPMTYSGIALPVKDLELLPNEKASVAKIARLYGIQEDMILSGSTFDNKENAIIQTYTDFKGLIYNWITQIESEKIATIRKIDGYNITFPGVPQLNKTTVAQ